MGIHLIILLIFVLLAFWKRDAIFFIMAGGISAAAGSGWYSTYSDNTGFAFAVILFIFGLVMVVYAVKALLRKRRAAE